MHLAVYISSLCFVNAFGAHAPPISDTSTFPVSPSGPVDSVLQSPKKPSNNEQDPSKKLLKLSAPEQLKLNPELLEKALEVDLKLEELIRDVRRTGFGKKILRHKESNFDKNEEDFSSTFLKQELPFHHAPNQANRKNSFNSNSFENRDIRHHEEHDSTVNFQPKISEDHFFTHAREFKSELDHFLSHKPDLSDESFQNNPEEIRHLEEHQISRGLDHSPATFEDQHFLEYAREFKSELDHYLNKKQSLNFQPISESEVRHSLKDTQQFNQQDTTPFSPNFKFQEAEKDIINPQEFKTEVDQYFEKARASAQYRPVESVKKPYTPHLETKVIFKNVHESSVDNHEITPENIDFNKNSKDFQTDVERYFEQARASAQYAPSEIVAPQTRTELFPEKVEESKLENSPTVSLEEIHFNGNTQDFKTDVERYFEKARLSAKYASQKPAENSFASESTINKKQNFSPQENHFLGSLTRSEQLSTPHSPLTQDFNSNIARAEEGIISNYSPNFNNFQLKLNDFSAENDAFVAIPAGSRLRPVHVPVPKRARSFALDDKQIQKSEQVFHKGLGFLGINRRGDVGLSGPYPKPSEGHRFRNIAISRPYPGSKSEEGHSLEHVEISKPYPVSTSEAGHVEISRPKSKEEFSSKCSKCFGNFKVSKPYPVSTTEEGHVEISKPYPVSTSKEEHSFTLVEVSNPGIKSEEGHVEDLKPYPVPISEREHNFERVEVSKPYPVSKSEEGHSFGHVEVSKPYPVSTSEEGHSFGHVEVSKPYPVSTSEEGHSFEHVEVSKPYPVSTSEEGHSFEHVEVSKPYPVSTSEEGHSFEHFEVSKPYPVSTSEEGHSFEHVEVSKPYPVSTSEEGHSFEHVEVSKPYPVSTSEGHSFEHVEVSKPYPVSTSEEGHVELYQPYPKSEKGHSLEHVEISKPYPVSTSEAGHVEISRPKSKEEFSSKCSKCFGNFKVSKPYPVSTTEEGHVEISKPYPVPTSEEGHSFGDVEVSKPYPVSTSEEEHSFTLVEVSNPRSKSEHGHVEVLRPYPVPISKEGHTFVRVEERPKSEGHSFEHVEETRPYPGPNLEGHSFGHIEETRPYPGSKSEGPGFGHVEESKSYTKSKSEGHIEETGSKSEEGHSFRHFEESKPYPRSNSEEHIFGHIKETKPYPGSKSVEEHSFERVEEARPYPGSKSEGENSSGRIEETRPHPESKSEKGHSFVNIEVTTPYPGPKTKEGHSFIQTDLSKPYPGSISKEVHSVEIPTPQTVDQAKVFVPYPAPKAILTSSKPSTRIHGLRHSLAHFLKSQLEKSRYDGVTAPNLEHGEISVRNRPFNFEDRHSSSKVDEFPPYPPSISDHSSNPPVIEETHSLVHNTGYDKKFGNVELFPNKSSSKSSQFTTNGAPETNPELDISGEHSSNPYPRPSPYPPSNDNTLPRDQLSDEIQFLEHAGEFQLEDGHSSGHANKGNLLHVPVKVNSQEFKTNLQSSLKNINRSNVPFVNLGKHGSVANSEFFPATDVPRVLNEKQSFISDSLRISQPTDKPNQKQSAVYIPVPKSELKNLIKNNQGSQQSFNSFNVFSTTSDIGSGRDHVYNTLALINSDHTINDQDSDNNFVPTLPHKFTNINHVSALSPENSAVLPPESSPDKEYIPSLPFRLHHLSKQLNKKEEKSAINDSDQSTFTTTRDPAADLVSKTSEDSFKESQFSSTLDSDLDVRRIDEKHKSLSSTQKNIPAGKYGLPEFRR